MPNDLHLGKSKDNAFIFCLEMHVKSWGDKMYSSSHFSHLSLESSVEQYRNCSFGKHCLLFWARNWPCMHVMQCCASSTLKSSQPSIVLLDTFSTLNPTNVPDAMKSTTKRQTTKFLCFFDWMPLYVYIICINCHTAFRPEEITKSFEVAVQKPKAPKAVWFASAQKRLRKLWKNKVTTLEISRSAFA